MDTGLKMLEKEFMEALRSQIAPGDLRWIWLTHAHPDHIGNLAAVLAEAPNARIAVNFLCMAELILGGLPTDGVHLMQTGASLDVGDRVLEPVRPPYYDSPETAGLFDPSTRVFYCADCFGALLPNDPGEKADAIAPDVLRAGLLAWSSLDSPYLDIVDPERFQHALDEVRRLDAATILSAHLPPATGVVVDRMLDWLREAYVERRKE